MGIDYESVIFYGSNNIKIYNKLPKDIRVELDDGGDMGTFKFKDFGIKDGDYEDFYIEKYTDYDGDFVGFGVELSIHHFESDYTCNEINPLTLLLTEKALKVESAAYHFKLGRFKIYHRINIC